MPERMSTDLAVIEAALAAADPNDVEWSLIAELVERVKAAEAEVERLARWKSEALPVMDGLQELGRSLGLILGDSITGPKAHAAAEALKSRATTAEATIARVRALADEHPGTAWNSGLNLRQALRDALGVKVTRFTSANGPGLAPEDTPAPAEPVEPTCGCRTCNPDARWMVVCGLCGNKRCPHAWHHDYRCTGSNEPNQEPQPILRPTDQRYEPPAVDDCGGCCR